MQNFRQSLDNPTRSFHNYLDITVPTDSDVSGLSEQYRSDPTLFENLLRRTHPESQCRLALNGHHLIFYHEKSLINLRPLSGLGTSVIGNLPINLSGQKRKYVSLDFTS